MSVIELDGFVLNGTEYEMRDKLAQQRISEQIAGNTNPTEGNSELLDIRVGRDGTRYETAGDAVREQILNEENERREAIIEVSSDIMEAINLISNILEDGECEYKPNLIYHKQINNNTGIITDTTMNVAISNLIRMVVGSTLTVRMNGYSLALFWYNEDGSFAEKQDIWNSKTYDIIYPYVRFYVYKSDLSDFPHKPCPIDFTFNYVIPNRLNKPNKLIINDETAEISFRGNKITLSKVGINNLMQISKIDDGIFNAVSTSDYISPYIVKSINDTVTGAMYAHTGGWHGSDGGQGGKPTAKFISAKYLVDNKEVSEDGEYYGESIQVVATHQIKSWNTINASNDGRYVIEEVITYTFKDGKMYVNGDIKALEDINITYYHAMQSDKYSKSCILLSEDKVKYNEYNFGTEQNIDYYPNYALLESNMGTFMLMHLESFGIAKQGSWTDTSRFYTIQAYGKSGWNVIGYRDFLMSQDEKIAWKGYYEFLKTKTF